MKIKIIIILSIVFTIIGIAMGVIANGTGNTSFLLISLTIIALFLVGMNISAFKMLRKSSHVQWAKGYDEATKDIMSGIKQVYNEKGCDLVAKATMQIIAEVTEEQVEAIIKVREQDSE